MAMNFNDYLYMDIHLMGTDKKIIGVNYRCKTPESSKKGRPITLRHALSKKIIKIERRVISHYRIVCM
jgi:hypothetical protein